MAEAFVLPVSVLLTVVGFCGFDPLTVGFPLPTLADIGLDAPVAVIVTGVLPLTSGAVKIPSREIVPALVDQVTAVFGLPLIRATNCNFSNDVTVAVLGESVSALVELEFAGAAAPAFCDRELQPTVRPLRQSTSARMAKFTVGF